MFHFVYLVSTLLWRRPTLPTSLSNPRSDVGNNDRPSREEVASTCHSNFTSVDNVTTTSLANQNQNPFENDAATSKVKNGVEILEVKEDAEECPIDLTTLLQSKGNSMNDDISMTKTVADKGTLAEYMARYKIHKHSDHQNAEIFTSELSETQNQNWYPAEGRHHSQTSVDILELLERGGKKGPSVTLPTLPQIPPTNENYTGFSQNQNLYPSEGKHHSQTSVDLLELLKRGDERGPSAALPTCPQTPPTTSKNCAGFSVSPTYIRKMKPFRECFEGYRANCFYEPTSPELPTQQKEKRKYSCIEEPVAIIDLTSEEISTSKETSTSRKKSKQTLNRHWEWSNFGLKCKKKPQKYPGVQFSIMSYNLLAQDLLEFHSHLYSYCDNQVLLWEYRRARLLEEIDKYLPDIMCFQEVQCDHYEDFLKPNLEKRGYMGIYCQKTGFQSDGCATFFQVMKFEVLNFRKVHYEKGGVLDRCNVGLIVNLKPYTSDNNLEVSELCIANTHLLFNPRRGDVKLGQLILLLAELDKAAYKYHQSADNIVYHPTILCGDFNFEPFCRIYKLIVSQYLRYSGLLIREMAGVSDKHFGRDAYLSKDFFPTHLNITDSCQFVETVKERNLISASKLSTESSLAEEEYQSRELKEKSSHTAVCEDSRQPSPTSNEFSLPEEMLKPMGSGKVSHFFDFVSVYDHVIKHRKRRIVEVTTYHDRACETTDYIFYNLNSDTNGRLKLLCRYGLFSKEEVYKMDRLPNAELGSDHFSLIAHFLLTGSHSHHSPSH